MRIAKPYGSFALAALLGTQTGHGALPIELISVNQLGQQSNLTFPGFPQTQVHGTMAISEDGARVAYTTIDENFALDVQPAIVDIFYAQLMLWRRGTPGSVKTAKAPSGVTHVGFPTFDKLGTELCFYGFGIDYVTGIEHGSNFYCKHSNGADAYAGAFGLNGYLPHTVSSFRGGKHFDIYKFANLPQFFALEYQVAIRDRRTNAVEIVSVNNQGELAYDPTFSCVDSIPGTDEEISEDGRFALFDSCAPNLVPGDTSSSFRGTDLFIRDRTLRTTTRIMSDDGQELASVRDYDLSRDGRFAVFSATGYVTQDCAQIAGFHVYLYEIATRRLECISRDSEGELTSNFPGDTGTIQINDDAKFVIYSTLAPLDPRDNNQRYDVYVYDRIKRRSTLISDSFDGQIGIGGDASIPQISGDGNWAVFQSRAGNLLPNDLNGNRVNDIFLRDLRPLRGAGVLTSIPTLSFESLAALSLLMFALGGLAVRRLR